MDQRDPEVIDSTVQDSAIQRPDDALRGRTVLVVDDDPNLLRMLRRTFAFAGCQVAATEDGRQALVQIHQCEPDLVVLDVMLPEPLDGFEVVRRLRASGCDVPVLMLTARCDVNDRLEGFRSGADDYLLKPFIFDELLARAAALVRRGQQDRARSQTVRGVGYALRTPAPAVSDSVG